MEHSQRSGRPRPPEPAARETVLHGGIANQGLVVRVGDTVRRPRTRATHAGHAVLRHLEDVGFDGAPRVLGTDDRGREVLSFVEGTAVTPPYPSWALTDAALVSVARLLSRYHEAVRGFDPAHHVWGSSVPAPYRGDVVSHNDPNLDNVIFRDGHAVALIDFDLASPGSRLWDVALAARLWVPLRDPGDVHDDRRHRMVHRLRLFAAASRLDEHDLRRLPHAVLATHGWSYGIVDAGASRGQPGFLEYWTPEARAREERGRAWITRSLPTLLAALDP